MNKTCQPYSLFSNERTVCSLQIFFFTKDSSDTKFYPKSYKYANLFWGKSGNLMVQKPKKRFYCNIDALCVECFLKSIVLLLRGVAQFGKSACFGSRRPLVQVQSPRLWIKK